MSNRKKSGDHKEYEARSGRPCPETKKGAFRLSDRSSLSILFFCGRTDRIGGAKKPNARPTTITEGLRLTGHGNSCGPMRRSTRGAKVASTVIMWNDWFVCVCVCVCVR